MLLTVQEISKLQRDNERLRAFNSTIKSKYSSTQEEMARLKGELHWCRQQIFGTKKETLPKPVSENQLRLFDKKTSRRNDYEYLFYLWYSKYCFTFL